MGESRGERLNSPEEIIRLLDENCIFYMSIGMSYADYWEGDNCLPSFYLRAYQKRRKREIEEKNYTAWLEGFYNMNAFGVVLSNAFSDKNSSPAEYFDKPIELFPKEKTAEEKAQEQEAARLRMKIAMDNFAAAVNSQYKRKGQKNGNGNN